MKILSNGIQPSHANFFPYDRENSDSSPESPDGLVVSPDELRRYLLCITKITIENDELKISGRIQLSGPCIPDGQGLTEI